MVPNGGAGIEVLFSPIIDADARATDIDGAVFEIWSGGLRLYQRRVLPQDLIADRVTVPPVADGRAATDIAFITQAPSGGAAHATWQRVRFARP
jgi:hypothetical protein